ncbi:MFS transporter [Tetragenococcus halophilus]|uniref:Drug resistance efflux protein n=1 Tax=Tetragenococcus halophilus (strain DSM 20338 / JCM 20259 / NCIMB 9735 / NBRC 12172) TaxID=945021 RepID=A0AAN1VRS2_TETHN|nr:MFS transporter [Tetragenococcus halophilus]BAK95387.1 putative drug resistance efflux protein [Tetragenococcus halophilus NBRC 12172]GBD71601.1 putative drug resistance efflux protein [Tetragenococcus halophilus subsp. halophilus]GFK23808.1 major facilitator superfamily transporter [Tetragenococcus halophilus]GMG62427.1 MFS transporter [Tetragenococcus halophilus]GMG64715.1 MFS transporter [Tetragenococcus halophilus]
MEKVKIHLLPAVLAAGIMSFSGVLIETAMNVTFPTLTSEFNISTSMVQWVTTIYLLVISIMVPFSNYLIKNFSIRKLFMIANFFFIAGLITDFISPTFFVLLLGRILQGISTGIALPLMFHIILTFTPLEKRGGMMGVGMLTTSIAPAVGPTYGGLLTSVLSWHYIFLFLIPILLLSLVLGLYAIPEISVEKNSKLDITSLLGIALLFSGLLVFLNQMGSIKSLFPLFIGMIGLVIFLQRSVKSPFPLVKIDVLKDKAFVLFLCGFLVCQFLLLGISFVLPNFVQIVSEENAFIAGLVMLPGATVGAILAPVSGRVLDKYGAKKPILIGLILAAIGWIALTLLLKQPSLAGFVAGHVFYMIGLGFAYSNMMTSGMNLLTQEEYGDGNTLFNTLQQFSGAVATSIVASVINIFQENNTDYQLGTTIGAQVAMFILLTLLLIIIIACIIHFRPAKNRVEGK